MLAFADLDACHVPWFRRRESRLGVRYRANHENGGENAAHVLVCRLSGRGISVPPGNRRGKLYIQSECSKLGCLLTQHAFEFLEGKNSWGGALHGARSGQTLEVRSPHTGSPIGRVPLSGAEDVAAAVKAAESAAATWGATPIKERVRPLQRFYDLVTQHSQEIAALASLESGKTPAEALAGLQRGLEVVEFAVGLPNLDRGG